MTTRLRFRLYPLAEFVGCAVAGTLVGVVVLWGGGC